MPPFQVPRVRHSGPHGNALQSIPEDHASQMGTPPLGVFSSTEGKIQQEIQPQQRNEMSKLILIVDVDNMVHTDFGAARERAADIGLARIAAFRERFEPADVIGATEGDNNWRRELLPSYKAKREEKDPLLLAQIEDFKRRCGFVTHKPDRGEADDAIATLVEKRKGDNKVVVMSRDKDMHQLLEKDRVVILKKFNRTDGLVDKGRHAEWYSTASLAAPVTQNGWGISPDLCVDYQAVVGDSADGVPGAPKIGPKTISPLLWKHKSIEEILRSADLTAKRREALESILPNLEVTRKVLTLDRDCGLSVERVESHVWKLILLNGDDDHVLVCNCGKCNTRFYGRVRSSTGDDQKLLQTIRNEIEFLGFYDPNSLKRNGGYVEDVS